MPLKEARSCQVKCVTRCSQGPRSDWACRKRGLHWQSLKELAQLEVPHGLLVCGGLQVSPFNSEKRMILRSNGTARRNAHWQRTDGCDHGTAAWNAEPAWRSYRVLTTEQNWAFRTVLSGARLAGLQTTTVSGMCRCASPSRLILAGASAQLSDLSLPTEKYPGPLDLPYAGRSAKGARHSSLAVAEWRSLLSFLGS
jgi:hypothetical protein